ncbi:hypothetical protein EVA_16622 [gut metagenome]|uniref:Uncharacterized protein n=1 Tax=gut metagenome TaxID=749906 RepID=J9C604_9ZZZZ
MTEIPPWPLPLSIFRRKWSLPVSIQKIFLTAWSRSSINVHRRA